MKSILLAILLTTSAALAETQSPAPAEPPKARAEQFLAGLVAGDVDASFDKLFADSRSSQPKSEWIDPMKRQLSEGLPARGKPLRFELVEERPVGSSVLLLTYVLVMERHPVVLKFIFYRPEKTWIMDTIRFDDQLPATLR